MDWVILPDRGGWSHTRKGPYGGFPRQARLVAELRWMSHLLCPSHLLSRELGTNRWALGHLDHLNKSVGLVVWRGIEITRILLGCIRNSVMTTMWAWGLGRWRNTVKLQHKAGPCLQDRRTLPSEGPCVVPRSSSTGMVSFWCLPRIQKSSFWQFPLLFLQVTNHGVI